MLDVAAPGATFLLNSPFGAGRGVGAPAGRDPAGDHREGAPVLRRRRPEGRDRGGTRPAHQHDPADLLLRARGRPADRRGRSPRIKARDREELRQARATPSSSRTSPRSTPRSTACTRCPCRPGIERRPASTCRRSPRTPPTSSSASRAMMIAGKGDLLPVSRAAGRRHVPDRHGEMGEALDRAGDPDLGPGRSASTAGSARSSVRTRRSG